MSKSRAHLVLCCETPPREVSATYAESRSCEVSEDSSMKWYWQCFMPGLEPLPWETTCDRLRLVSIDVCILGIEVVSEPASST